MNNQLKLFCDSVNGLIDCRLIMVNVHIENVLKCVALSPALTDCLAETAKNTSYATEFQRAKISLTRPDGKVVTKIKLPADRNRLFTFVVCLLTEVDSGRRNFVEFLKQFFFCEDSNNSYALFVEQVLKPFKRAGEQILKNVDPDSFDAQSKKRAEGYFKAESIYFNSELLRVLLGAVQTIREKCLRAHLEHEKAAECAEMCDALTNAAQLKNPKLLKVVWIGFSNTLKEFDFAQEYLDIVKSVLKQENVI